MIIFKKYCIVTEAKTREEVLTEIITTLEEDGYVVKMKGNRIYAYTKSNRREAMNNIIKLFKNKDARLVKPVNRAIQRLSSIGYVSLKDGIDIIVKPLGRNLKEAEETASNDLDRMIKEAMADDGKNFITIKIGNDKIKKVISASSKHIKGDPKADIALIDVEGKEVAFISHKKAGGASAFQQYSGLSRESGNEIYSSKLVKEFVRDIYDYLLDNYDDNVAQSGTSFLRPIPNNTEGKKLVGKAIFGSDWEKGSKKYSRDFVNCIGQGDPRLKKSGDAYVLDFTDAMHTSNDISWAFKGDYKAVLGATYRMGRRLESDGTVVENMRGGVYPESLFTNRNFVKL